MKLDFIICGTPNDAFCSQIAFYRMCLDNLGGIYQEARLVAVFGDHKEQKLPLRWRSFFKNIEIEWAHSPGELNEGHRAQHYHRFTVMRPDADIVVICDADTALMKPFPELLSKCKADPAIFGVIAHYPMPGQNDWQSISLEVIGKMVQLEYRYTLKPLDSSNESPFYINYGFLAGPPHLLTQLYESDRKLVNKVSRHVNSYWAPQVCIPFAIEDAKLSTCALPMRYNFPNDKIADSLYPEELQKIIVMHYLRTSKFDRHCIFSDKKNFNQFMDLELSGSDRIFQEFVTRLTSGEYPFSALH